jgi:competence protein ComEA
MHRQAQQEVEAAARRRLELLARELEQAGVLPLAHGGAPAADAPTAETLTSAADDLRDPAPVLAPGRHVRRGRPSSGRVRGALAAAVPATLQGRVGLGRGPALLVVALVALALTAAAVAAWRTAGESTPVVPALSHRSAAPLVPSASASGPTAGTTPAAQRTAQETGTVTVDVAGKVRRPGVRTLPAGSRVVDALDRAGGPRGRVDLTGLNLARVLVDGEQVLVGKPAAPGGIAAGVASNAPPSARSLVNINTATGEQLETLPGVGPVTAEKILAWRESHGTFSSVDELLEIDGIGEKTFAELAPLVTL